MTEQDEEPMEIPMVWAMIAMIALALFSGLLQALERLYEVIDGGR